MRIPINWIDHVRENPTLFTLTEQPGLPGVYAIAPYGNILQQGTPQNAENFNDEETALGALELAVGMLCEAVYRLNHMIGNAQVEVGSIELTQGTAMTVALDSRRENLNYIVCIANTSDVKVDEVEISNVLDNGFKLKYIGSAASKTVNYKIWGGWDA